MRAAAALLSTVRSIADLSEIVRATGIAKDTIDLDGEAADSLRLQGASALRMAAGCGAIRVLIAELAPDAALREWLPRTARSLASRAPHVLWLIAATTPEADQALLAGWSSGSHGIRIASLTWEPSHVVDSDAETLCALATFRGDADAVAHARFVEVLGRDSLTRRFFRAIEARVSSLAAEVPGDHEDRRSVALLYVSRLLFLAFLEAKGWLDGDRVFIASRFDGCMREGGGFHHRVLLPLFFGTLNTPVSRRARLARGFGRIPFLNGGLFTRTPPERRAAGWRFSDEGMGALLQDVFQRYRFVAREDSATWSDASVDPEMLGRVFESLMDAGDRKAAGVFFTPQPLVARVTDLALNAALETGPHGILDLRQLRVLDPACGSGAFLVYALERISDIRRARGDPSDVADIRRDVLARTVFGVDRNPMAVWLCELRLWLSIVIESRTDDPMRVPPLPNLDRNIRVGDALAGADFAPDGLVLLGSARLIALRNRYVRATGARKRTLHRALDREERRRMAAELEWRIAKTGYERRELLSELRARDLFGQRLPTAAEAKRESKQLRERLRSFRRELGRLAEGGALPFSFATFFADAQSAGGFDVVLGNPPWVRLHQIPAPLRSRLRRNFEVYRSAAWTAGASAAGAAPAFAGQVDLASLFVERSVRLLRPGGVVSLLLPMKLWRSLAGGGVRRFLLEHTAMLRLEDLTESRHNFDAAVYPSLVVARADVAERPAITLAVHEGTSQRESRVETASLSYDRSPGAPWLTLAPPARESFDLLRRQGSTLAASPFGAPRLGVKSGCNTAFVVRVTDTTARFASIVDADGETGSVELHVLRPVLRGDGIVPWTRPECAEWIIWTHDETGAPLARLPDRTRAWLHRRYGALAMRSDARGRRWWSLFRVDAARSDRPRVVWADFGRRPRALVLPAGDQTVPLNTCYVLPCDEERDAWALATLLNSSLAAAWLNAIAEPARGGYRRYLGWTVGQLPLPTNWYRARVVLARARASDEPTVLAAVLEAYRLDRRAVADLLAEV
jgi:hypothetical protein